MTTSWYNFILGSEPSFRLFLAFFELLGPAVDHLNFWGSKDGARKRCKLRKIDGKDQLFLVLLRLKLNLKHKDLAHVDDC